MPAQSERIESPGNHSGVRITPRVIVSKSPTSGEVLGEVQVATPLQIRDALAEARLSQPAWEGIGLGRRLRFIRSLRDALYRRREQIVDTLVAEQGKVRYEVMLEYLATIELVDYYLREARHILAPEAVPVRLVPHRLHRIERRPFGVVLVISPWNYPLFLALNPVVAALLAGNTVLLKPSEYATQVGELIAALLQEAGIPREVFHILHGYGDVGASLVEAHPDRIVFTGSVAVGKQVTLAAAENLIPVTLELGGKDAAIVLDDADIDRAARGIVWSGMFNAGQTCAGVERVVVERKVADRLLEAMKGVVERYLAAGDRLPGGYLAAITTAAQMEVVEQHVREAVRQGARVVVGGQRLGVNGQYFAPTILTDVTPQMKVAREETFGPVIAVMPVADEQEAIRYTNDTPYGLTASIWTRNRARGLRLACHLRVGNISLNEHLLISGIPEMPWGGVKESGYGRTQGREGLLSMTYAQTINMDRFRLPLEVFWYSYSPLKNSLVNRAIHLLYGPGLRDRLRALWP